MSSELSTYTLYLEKWRRSVPAGWGAVDSSGEAAQPLRDLERLAHTLAGTAGTLGFHETGAAARVLELLLEQAGEVGPALTPAQRSDIAQAITALQASLPAG